MNNMPIVKTSAKCQIVIPSEIRKKLGIKAGGKVLIEKLDDQHAIISALPDDPIKSLRGVIKGGKSMAQELLEERREDNLHEEKQTA
jgi:AbrB family looped-hinge helix DNA binding protein